MARAGKEVTIAPRTVKIIEARLDGIMDGPPVSWNITIRVSKGFYVRSLARDLGESFGTAAHLGGLRRLASGKLSTSRARPLESLQTADDISKMFSPAREVLELETISVSSGIARQVATGAELPGMLADEDQPGPFALVAQGKVIAIYARAEESLRAEAVFPGGIA